MDLSPLLDALAAHNYLMVVALLVATLVGLAKSGWMSAWLASKLPAIARPWVALALGALGTMSAAVVAGGDIKKALLDGLMAALAAIAGHELVVESARGGREVVPRAPWMEPKVG